MTDQTTATAYARACKWLELLGECSEKLTEVDAEIKALGEISDDLRAQRYDGPNVPNMSNNADRLGVLVAARRERMAELVEERETLETATRNAKQIMAEAARATDDAMAVKGFAFVWLRRIRGMRAKDAARALRTNREAAYYHQRRFISALIEYDPARFTIGRLPHGWREFARGGAGAGERLDQ